MEVPVSLKRRLRTLFCCAVLEVGVLFGVPMRPEQIRELMQMLNKPKIAQAGPEQAAHGDEPDAGAAAAR